MLVGANLTPEQFKQVHNALCKLNSIADRLGESIKTELHDSLVSAVETIRSQFSAAYEQDDAMFEERTDHYEQQATVNGIKHSSWSMHEVADLLAPHGYGPIDRVVYDNHWGEIAVSSSVQGNTWVALWRAADECIRLSEDHHHIFVEDFRVSEHDPRTLILSTGS